MNGFESEVRAYVEAVDMFRMQYDLPEEWFQESDHLAYKCLDGNHYQEMMRRWKPAAFQMTEVRLNKRRLGTVHLRQSIAVGVFGFVQWLEIMEPRPEKVGKDVVGIDHMEFNFPDFDVIRRVLGEKSIPFEPESNPNHAWISVMANGRELKLNDKPLAQICQEEIAAGKATILV